MNELGWLLAGAWALIAALGWSAIARSRRLNRELVNKMAELVSENEAWRKTAGEAIDLNDRILIANQLAISVLQRHDLIEEYTKGVPEWLQPPAAGMH